MFFMRNKENIFSIRSLIWRPEYIHCRIVYTPVVRGGLGMGMESVEMTYSLLSNFEHQVNSDLHLQTVKIQMRRLLMSRLIRNFNVSLVKLVSYSNN